MDSDALPDWERLLAAERHLQALVPGTVLVGRTAAGWQTSRMNRPVAILGTLDGMMTGIRQPIDWTVPLPHDDGLA